MVIAVAVLATLAFIGWMVFRVVRDRAVKAHLISYGLAVIAGVFTYAYFLSLDLPQLVKIITSILLGIVLIVVAAAYQQRRSRGV